MPNISVPSISVPTLSVPKKFGSINVLPTLPTLPALPSLSFKQHRQNIIQHLTCNLFQAASSADNGNSSSNSNGGSKKASKSKSSNRCGTRRNAIRKKSSELERRTIDTKHISTISSLVDKGVKPNETPERESQSTNDTNDVPLSVSSASNARKSECQKDNYGLYALKFNRSVAAKRNSIITNLPPTVDSLNYHESTASPSVGAIIQSQTTRAINAKKHLATTASEFRHEYFQPCQANANDGRANRTQRRQISDDDDNDPNEYLKIEFNETGGLEEIKTCHAIAGGNSNPGQPTNTIKHIKNSKNNDIKKINSGENHPGCVPQQQRAPPPPVPPKRNKNINITPRNEQRAHHTNKPISPPTGANELKQNTAITQKNGHAATGSQCVQSMTQLSDTRLVIDGSDSTHANAEKSSDFRRNRAAAFRNAANDNKSSSYHNDLNNICNNRNINASSNTTKIKDRYSAGDHCDKSATALNHVQKSFNDNSINRCSSNNYDSTNDDNVNDYNQADVHRAPLANTQLARKLTQQSSSSFESVNIFKRGGGSDQEFDEFDQEFEPVRAANERRSSIHDENRSMNSRRVDANANERIHATDGERPKLSGDKSKAMWSLNEIPDNETSSKCSIAVASIDDENNLPNKLPLTGHMNKSLDAGDKKPSKVNISRAKPISISNSALSTNTTRRTYMSEMV